MSEYNPNEKIRNILDRAYELIQPVNPLPKRYFGPVVAEINTTAGRAILTYSPGRQPVSPGTIEKLTEWAVMSLHSQGLQVDLSRVAGVWSTA